MENKNQQLKSLQFITCSSCNEQNFKHCKICHGNRIIAWTGNVSLYWGKRINNLQISQDNLKLLIKNGINLILFLFGALGLILFGWKIISLSLSGLQIQEFYKIRGWQLIIFWMSMASNSYLFYRFQRDIEKNKYIPKKKYEDHPKTFIPASWATINSLPKNKKIDISQYFTDQAQRSVTKAWQLASKYEDNQANPIHLLISLLTFDQVQIIFSRLGVPYDKLKRNIQNTLAKQPPNDQKEVILSLEIQKIMLQAYFMAYQLRQKKVDVTELLEVLSTQENDVKELLYDLEITTDKITNVSSWLRTRKQFRENWVKFRSRASLKPKGNMNRAMTAIATPVLDSFSQDLTVLAKFGYLLPCIGRTEEMANIFQIMDGGTRRSVLLVGNSGVGRNTIIEGIAQKMVEENVPKFLKDKRLVGLDIASLVSGVSVSEAQQRLVLIINEIRRSGNIILYIKDIHKMTGISAGRQGSIDLADVITQVLAKNNILVLATTTPTDYKKFIEGKSSIDNSFELINIPEVSGNEAIRILQAKVGSLEYRNQVFFSYDAIEQTVNLSNRYLHDRYLPEKAIEILQEVATRMAGEKGKEAIIKANDVARVISEKTNIPLTDITQNESKVLLNMEKRIHQRVVGQDEAVSMVANSLRRARAQMRDTKRPIVNLLFLGPTGVGKTELAKTVAEVYFNNENNMVRLDMSEYQDQSSINRLIGSSTGSSEGGYLTEAIRKNPFSLVLLDEIEKAHPDILNIFLQLMDDGRLTDNTGRTIDFTNTIIIATSNAGTSYIQQEVKKGTAVELIKQNLIDRHLNQYFRPELLNRFDGIVVFKPLSMDNVIDIAKLMLQKVKKDLESRGIILKATQQAVIELAKAGYDPEFGARPLRRVIQEKIQDSLATKILSNEVGRRDTVTLVGGGEIKVTKANQI